MFEKFGHTYDGFDKIQLPFLSLQSLPLIPTIFHANFHGLLFLNQPSPLSTPCICIVAGPTTSIQLLLRGCNPEEHWLLLPSSQHSQQLIKQNLMIPWSFTLVFWLIQSFMGVTQTASATVSSCVQRYCHVSKILFHQRIVLLYFKSWKSGITFGSKTHEIWSLLMASSFCR